MQLDSENIKIIRDSFTSPHVVIYHWDADGIIGAMHAVMASNDKSVLLPPRFTYKPGDDYIRAVIDASHGKEYIIIIDISFRKETLKKILYSVKSNIVVVDHHFTRSRLYHNRLYYINPAQNRDPEGKWPSASHIIALHLGDYNPLLIAASIVGDLGERAKANAVYQNYMVEAGLDPIRDFDIPKIIAENLDSLGIMGNYEGLTWIPRVHAIGDRDPAKSIIDDPYLINLKVQAEIELEELIADLESNTIVEGSIAYYYAEGEGRHVSKLSRHLASLHSDKVTVVGYAWKSTGIGYIYVRTLRDDIDLAQLIELYENRVRSIGGKRQKMNNVIGMELEAHRVKEIMQDVVSDLKNIIKSG